MVIDMLDVVLVDALQAMPILNEDQVGFGDNYQRFDKWLDMYYLTIEAYITFSWRNKLARNAAVALFIFRFLGIGIFEVTGEQFRQLIFFFPNLFENFFSDLHRFTQNYTDLHRFTQIFYPQNYTVWGASRSV